MDKRHLQDIISFLQAMGGVASTYKIAKHLNKSTIHIELSCKSLESLGFVDCRIGMNTKTGFRNKMIYLNDRINYII